MPKQRKDTGFKIDQAIHAAMAGESKPLVYLPPGRRTETRVVPTKVTDVKQQLIRIEHQADPLGFLFAALHGAVFDVQIVTETGQVLKIQEQVSLKDRVKIAMFLANKQLPNLTLTRVVQEPAPGSEKPGDGGSGMTFAQMVARAAHNGDQPRQITVIEQEPVKDDG